MLDPASEVERPPRDAEAVGQCRRINAAQLLNRLAQFGRYALVGVNPENPIAGCLRVRELVLVFVPAKLAVEDLVSVAARISAARSVESESTITISSAHATVSQSAAMFSSSLRTMMEAEIFKPVWCVLVERSE
jgi:hypothetical protein